MFFKWLLATVVLIVSINGRAETSCNVEPGIYVSSADGRMPENADLLFNPQNYSDDLLLDLKGRLMLTVDEKKQMSMAGFVQKRAALLYKLPIIGRFAAYPEIEKVEFSQLQSVCTGNLVVLSWLGGEGENRFSFSGILQVFFDNRTNSVFSTLPSLFNFSVLFGSGEVSKQLHLKKLDIPFEADLPEPDECLIPDGVYEGMQSSDLIEIEIDNSNIDLTLQKQGVIYNDPPVVPKRVLYDCQGTRLVVIYMNNEDRNMVFAGEWDGNKKIIESMQRIETLVKGQSLNVTLTPAQ
ncbi:hypothetical protein [Endozoicomonas lisbonensis]|uniref:Uncharacterized protein n=1 Tax=Endozoicomonas lisbonensis TaxID=3120522 RepID=A0ABV2SM80_9GAMM